jgi:alpha-L-rhamnosidase
MFIDRCTDVKIEGLEFADSGFWNLHLYKCRNVLVEGLNIHSPTTGNILAPSTDGIDVDSCQSVTIHRCKISVNDDNIALKGSKGPFAAQDADSPPVEDIRIEGCEFGDGNGMVTCGSEATTVRRVTVKDCTITGHTNLLCLKLRPDTPQDYEDISIDGVKVTGGRCKILQVASWKQFFDLKGQPPPSRVIRNVTIRNVSGSAGRMGVLHGNPGDLITGITLENIDLQIADPRLDLGPVEHLTLKEVKVNGAAFVLPEVRS